MDIRRLPIGPEEAFVWSRVDGTVGVNQIAHLTGLAPPQVQAALDKLRQLGAVLFEGDPAPAPPQRQPSASVPPTETPAAEDEPSGGPVGGQQRARIETMLRALGEQDHYQLLGIARSAEKQTIKAAYFELVSEFHPDKYFGKDLGELKPRLERVFKGLTDAHDTLTRAKRRREYDATLPPEAPPSRATSNAVSEAAAADAPEATPPPAPPRSGSSANGVPSPNAEPAVVISSNSSSASSDATRRAVARRLAASVPPRSSQAGMRATAASSPDVKSDAQASKQEPQGINLRGFKRPDPLQRHLHAADRAEAEGNLTAALNSLRLALSLDPKSLKLSERLRKLEQRADVEFASDYAKQARIHESQAEYQEAARLYARAGRGQGNAAQLKKAAECAMKVDDGLRKAAEHAKGAVALEPENADLRLFLGKIYARAGMRSSALSELDKALLLSPEDETIKSWLNRVKRGDV